nr:unnamed protein product [Spirometra erinaceieuropaei]
MNGSHKEIDTIINNLKSADLDPNVDIVLGAPACYLQYAQEKAPKGIHIAAENCYKLPSGAFTGQTGRRLSPRIREHKRAVQRGDPLSKVATHTLEEGHEFDFANTRILARAGNKTRRELLEAWVSGANSSMDKLICLRATTRSAHAAR